MSMSDRITPPEPSSYQVKCDIQAECKKYINAKDELANAKVEVEENEASMKLSLEYLSCHYDIDDPEEIERIANDRDFT